MKPAPDRGGLVYSTELGRTCPQCRQPLAACLCLRRSAPPQGDGIVRVSRETKGRKGKGVTLVKGVPLGEAELTALARQLKAACSSGGTVKDGNIEIQGDHADKLVERLVAEGFKVKRPGG